MAISAFGIGTERSIKYQLSLAKLPLAKDIKQFDFTGTSVNEAPIRELASAALLAEQLNVVLIGGTGTGKSHLVIARVCIRGGKRARFFNTVDLVNRLDGAARVGRQGRLADYLIRLDFIALDELGYLPSAQAGGQLLLHLVSRLYERTIALLDRCRRLAKDWKCLNRSALAFVKPGSIRLILQRLCNPS